MYLTHLIKGFIPIFCCDPIGLKCSLLKCFEFWQQAINTIFFNYNLPIFPNKLSLFGGGGNGIHCTIKTFSLLFKKCNKSTVTYH